MHISTAFNRWTFIALMISAATISCDPGPVTVHLLSYNPDEDRYEFQVQEITTLENVARMRGRATELIAGTDLTLDYVEQQIRWQSDGNPVAMGYFIHDNVVYPEDFSSMVMAAVYRNIELAMLMFEDAGLPPDLLPAMQTYYEARVTVIEYDFWGEKQEYQERDNAFYLPISETDRGFYVLPYDEFQTLPLPVNTGIMAHEYTHAVFDELVYIPLGSGTVYNNWPLYNEFAALNEGLADGFAVALTGDPDFMSHSISDDWSRDASRSIYYNAIWDVEIQNAQPKYFDPYHIGEFLSAFFYETTRLMDGAAPGELISEASRREMARLMLAALEAFGSQKSSAPDRISDYLSFLVAHMTDAQTAVACGVLLERYTIHYERVTPCK
jgi:hypothetical protein